MFSTIGGIFRFLSLLLFSVLLASCGGGGGGGDGFTGDATTDTDTDPQAVTLTVTLNGSTSGTVGAAYNASLAVSGGTAPYTFAITTGSLPDGVVLNEATGALSGTPTKAGAFGFTAQVTEKDGAQGAATFTITVSGALTMTLSGPTSSTVGTAYSARLVVSGGTAPYTFEITTGSLPDGVTLNAATGLLSGTSTTAGVFGFTARVTDSNGATGTNTFTITVTGSTTTVGSLNLLANPPQLESSGQIPVNLTAVVRDTNNVLLENITVIFNATNNGTLQVTRAVTDATGTATAILTSPGDKSNRDVTVTATASDQQDSVLVPVIGTTITSTGPNSAVIGNQVDITFTLKDSAGVGISGQTLTITSEPAGNTIDDPSPVTNTAGQATVRVTANVTGSIVASALGATGSHALTVATDRFVFTVPDPDAEPIDICLNATNCTPPRKLPPQILTVRLTTGNPPVGVANKTVAFETTRGILSASSAVTNSNGYASVTIRSTNAGPAVITATTTDTASQPIQAQAPVNFVATTPTQMTLQANPGTVSVNVPPNTDQKSTITATVRDVAFNLVKGVTVTFVLTDVTGGSISPASAVTDQFGQASTVYTAGSTSSALNGVRVDAAVTGFPAVTRTVNLTVAQRSLFITLGTGNTIEEPDVTTYEYPYSVLVTDTAGLPVQNASVTLNIVPVAKSTELKAYFKGYYALSEDATPPWIWTPTATQDGTYGCFNEDLNQNGILDLGEDFNNNGTLEPGNVVTVFPTSMRTDESGFAFFKVRYAQEYANWVRAELSARATVAGSEATEIARFILKIAASDISSKDVSPPGNPSPFGESGTCADDK